MIIACGTVLFRKYPLEKALETIRGIGYDYVETQAVGSWCPHVDIDKDDPIKYYELMKKHGFRGTTALWMPHGAILNDDKCVEWGLRTLEWASTAGIPVVNTGDGFKPSIMDDEEAYRIYEDRMGRLIEAAEQNKTVIAIEPHGTFSLTGTGLVRLMSISDTKWLGINFDACNFVLSAFEETKKTPYSQNEMSDRTDILGIFKKVFRRVVHFHAKDFMKGVFVPLGEGVVPLVECISLLKEYKYTGAVSLETQGDEEYEISRTFASMGYKYLNEHIK